MLCLHLSLPLPHSCSLTFSLKTKYTLKNLKKEKIIRKRKYIYGTLVYLSKKKKNLHSSNPCCSRVNCISPPLGSGHPCDLFWPMDYGRNTRGQVSSMGPQTPSASALALGIQLPGDQVEASQKCKPLSLFPQRFCFSGSKDTHLKKFFLMFIYF